MYIAGQRKDAEEAASVEFVEDSLGDAEFLQFF